MVSARQLTAAGLAMLSLGSAAVQAQAAAAINTPPAESISADPYPNDVPTPADPPGCWGADSMWYPGCREPAMMDPDQWGPGMGPGMMGPGPWDPGPGPGMMRPGT